MGSLTPDVPLIYESPDSGQTVYSREVGQTERKLVGYSHIIRDQIKQNTEDQLWHDIREAGKSNPSVQDALDRVIILYNLTRINK